MSGVFTGGIVGGLLHFGWSLSHLVFCWVMHARNRINDMLVLMVRVKLKRRRSNMQACCDKERERAAVACLSMIAAQQLEPSGLCQLRFRHRQGPDGRAFTCQYTSVTFMLFLM